MQETRVVPGLLGLLVGAFGLMGCQYASAGRIGRSTETPPPTNGGVVWQTSKCPHCGLYLAVHPDEPGRYHICSQCEGLYITTRPRGTLLSLAGGYVFECDCGRIHNVGLSDMPKLITCEGCRRYVYGSLCPACQSDIFWPQKYDKRKCPKCGEVLSPRYPH